MKKRRNERLVKVRRRMEKKRMDKERTDKTLENLLIVDSEAELDQFVFTVEQAQKAEACAAMRENRAGRDIEIYQTLGWRYRAT